METDVWVLNYGKQIQVLNMDVLLCQSLNLLKS